MQLKDIQNIKTITLTIEYVTENSENVMINVEFIPDFVIVKSVSIFDNDNEVQSLQIFQVKSSLISDNTSLFTFPKGGSNRVFDGTNIIDSIPTLFTQHLKPETIFKLYNPVNGLYSFTVLNQLGKRPLNVASFNMTILLTLEFVKLK